MGNNFATTEADIVEMATRLAATGELAGLTEPQIMALAILKFVAHSFILATTGFNISTKSMITGNNACPNSIATSFNEDFASVAGMTADQFKKAFQQDSVGALSAFIEGLNDTERNGKPVAASLVAISTMSASVVAKLFPSATITDPRLL